MNKNIIFALVFLFGACTASKPARKVMTKAEAEAAMAQNRSNAKVKAVWMREINAKNDSDFYLEVAQDGSILSREESGGAVTSRQGKITARFAKDLIRETERSDVFSGHSKSGTDFMKTGGMKVYAYISGELTIADATLSELGKNFDHALTELTKEVSNLPIKKDIAGLLYCETVPEKNLPSVNKKIAIDGVIEIVETADVKKFPPLLSAVLDPGRMIPLEDKAKTRQLSDFIEKYDLLGSRSEFILPSTRGTFTCHMLNTYREAVQKPLTDEEKYDAMEY